MLVPLETLSGWPAVADPSPLAVLALLVGAPAVVIALVFGISKVRGLASSGSDPGDAAVDPVWVGAPDKRDIEVNQGARAAIEAGRQTESGEAGGASARW
ncbi:MAG: hypothetical protein JWP61_836 [Friedmanniella sp.]|nr:hypothetical protein [Friedmanniella sp.]